MKSYLIALWIIVNNTDTITTLCEISILKQHKRIKILNKLQCNCLVRLVDLSATATLLGSIPRSSKVLLGLFMKFSVARRR